MLTFIISYDLLKTEDSERYQKLANAIESLGDAKEIQRSVWLLRPSKLTPYTTPQSLLDTLFGYVDKSDRLFVGYLNSYDQKNPINDFDDDGNPFAYLFQPRQ